MKAIKATKENTLNGIDAIIFDLDGTLLNSMTLWGEIDHLYLNGLGIAVPEGLRDDIEGMSFTEIAVYFKERFHISDSLEEIMAEWNEMAFERYAAGIPMKDGAKQFIAEMHRKGIRLGINTSNSRTLLQAAISAHELSVYFDALCTGEDVSAGKPDPEGYLTTAAMLNIKPENCLVFEDLPLGILAGKNAGMRTCAVKDSFSDPQWEKKLSLADYYIESYVELL